jgi:glutamyl-tRNA synthetase
LTKIKSPIKSTLVVISPLNSLKFKDLIRGEITTKVDLIGDFILVKKDKTPLYHFAVVIDDHEMDISHVIRGEDHITNTFNQILLYQAFGWQSPKFAHLPLILSEDGSKLSKRKGNIVSIEQFKNIGYLPEGLVNYMTLLGWGIKDQDKEIFSLDEAINRFKIEDVNSSSATFETDKLDYINGYYIRQKSNDQLLKLLQGGDYIDEKQNKEYLLKVISLVKDRMRKLSEFGPLAKYFFQKPKYNKDLLIFKKSDKEKTVRGLQAAVETLSDLEEGDWSDQEKINDSLARAVEEVDLANGDLFWPVRAALSGREASPSPSELLWALGKKESLDRLTTALDEIG